MARWISSVISLAIVMTLPGVRSVRLQADQQIPVAQAFRPADGAAQNPEPDGTTALHWAAQRNDLNAADKLIRAGANVKAANRYGITPLQVAATNGSAPMIEKLLAAGADPNTATPEGETVLMTAARTGDPAAVRMLLVHGATVNATENLRRQTALMWAAAEDNAEAAKPVIDAGAD